MSTELIISSAFLVVEIVVLLFLYFQSRKPPIPGKVRIFPYTAAMIIFMILLFLTLAHIVTLVTGTQVQPRRPKGMR